MDAADVAKIGCHVMKRGHGDVVAGLMNKAQAAMAAVTPQTVLAEMHRKQAKTRDCCLSQPRRQRSVRNVTEYLRRSPGMMLCCQASRTSPSSR